ncbi:MAG: hypothetical protein Q4F11_09155 [Eubacteriales bacterium]|nr:hypothetical protein [Eubacteriales bacterium]
MAETIDVKSIMSEIREDIQKKGYTNDMLSFDDVVMDAGAAQVTKFDKVKFNEEIFIINHEWNVQAYRPLQGGRISVFFKKVIRKLVYFFVEPIVISQDGFNASLVRMMNQMNCYIEEQDDEIKELKQKIADLEKSAKSEQ